MMFANAMFGSLLVEARYAGVSAVIIAVVCGLVGWLANSKTTARILGVALGAVLGVVAYFVGVRMGYVSNPIMLPCFPVLGIIVGVQSAPTLMSDKSADRKDNSFKR